MDAIQILIITDVYVLIFPIKNQFPSFCLLTEPCIYRDICPHGVRWGVLKPVFLQRLSTLTHMGFDNELPLDGAPYTEVNDVL